MHILVTGGAGFIGSHLVERLVGSGETVTVIDSFDAFYSPAAKRRNLAEVAANPRFRLFEQDIRDLGAADPLFDDKKIDVVVHLAARAGVRPSVENPILYADVNVRGTAAVLEFARRRGVGRFVFGSSSSVYGDDASVPFVETAEAVKPVSPYAATKRCGELLAYSHHQLYGMTVAVLRFFTAYGPRQRPDLAIHKFARRMLAGEPIEVFGDGSMYRDFTYVDDIVDGICAAIRWTQARNAYEIFNLGESAPVSVSELVGLLEESLGARAIVRHLPAQPGDVRGTYADITKAKTVLGYRPSIPMPIGLSRFGEWLRDEMALYDQMRAVVAGPV